MTGGTSDKEYMRINQFYMETSQNLAKYQGLKKLARYYSEISRVYVLQVTKNSTFKGILNIADTVTGVNDKTFNSSKELIDYVGAQKIGSKVKVNYVEDGRRNLLQVKSSNLKMGKMIGIKRSTEQVTTQHQLNFQQPVLVDQVRAW